MTRRATAAPIARCAARTSSPHHEAWHEACPPESFDAPHALLLTSQVAQHMRSNDEWHLIEQHTTLPLLSTAFPFPPTSHCAALTQLISQTPPQAPAIYPDSSITVCPVPLVECVADCRLLSTAFMPPMLMGLPLPSLGLRAAPYVVLQPRFWGGGYLPQSQTVSLRSDAGLAVASGLGLGPTTPSSGLGFDHRRVSSRQLCYI